MDATKIQDQLVESFELLRTVIKDAQAKASKTDVEQKLSAIESTISISIASVANELAPPNFYRLYDDFRSEFKRFKEFILYEQLIGKNIVALGGGFSSGKSSFLNVTALGKKVLPVDIDPSTSIPTYIVYDNKHKLSGINTFNARFEIENPLLIRKLSHGFGKISNESSDDEISAALDVETGKINNDIVSLGHIVHSLFFSTPLHKYEHFCFLDTPGYSKPKSEHHSLKTDEQIARAQLNGANYILWFIQAPAGTVTDEDIEFIRTLNENIPKLFIISKADDKPESEIAEIVAEVKEKLALRNISYVDVLAYSIVREKPYDIDKILEYLNKWNIPTGENNFAVNFKKLFTACTDYYDNEIKKEAVRFGQINKALTLTEDDDIRECLEYLLGKNMRGKFEAAKEQMLALQHEFFTYIHLVGKDVGIDMPEPDKLDVITDRIKNPLDAVIDYMKEKSISANFGSFTSAISEALADTSKNINLEILNEQRIEVLRNALRQG